MWAFARNYPNQVLVLPVWAVETLLHPQVLTEGRVMTSRLRFTLLLASAPLLVFACGGDGSSDGNRGMGGAGADGGGAGPDGAICDEGTLDEDGDPETDCVPWTGCGVGEGIT